MELVDLLLEGEFLDPSVRSVYEELVEIKQHSVKKCFYDILNIY